MRDILKDIRELQESGDEQFDTESVLYALNPDMIGAEGEEYEFLDRVRDRIDQSFPSMVSWTDIMEVVREPEFNEFRNIDTFEVLSYALDAAGLEGMVGETTSGGMAGVALPLVDDEDLDEDKHRATLMKRMMKPIKDKEDFKKMSQKAADEKKPKDDDLDEGAWDDFWHGTNQEKGEEEETSSAHHKHSMQKNPVRSRPAGPKDLGMKRSEMEESEGTPFDHLIGKEMSYWRGGVEVPGTVRHIEQTQLGEYYARVAVSNAPGETWVKFLDDSYLDESKPSSKNRIDSTFRPPFSAWEDDEPGLEGTWAVVDSRGEVVMNGDDTQDGFTREAAEELAALYNSETMEENVGKKEDRTSFRREIRGLDRDSLDDMMNDPKLKDWQKSEVMNAGGNAGLNEDDLNWDSGWGDDDEWEDGDEEYYYDEKDGPFVEIDPAYVDNEQDRFGEVIDVYQQNVIVRTLSGKEVNHSKGSIVMASPDPLWGDDDLDEDTRYSFHGTDATFKGFQEAVMDLMPDTPEEIYSFAKKWAIHHRVPTGNVRIWAEKLIDIWKENEPETKFDEGSDAEDLERIDRLMELAKFKCGPL